jgi:hypothetical protein
MVLYIQTTPIGNHVYRSYFIFLHREFVTPLAGSYLNLHISLSDIGIELRDYFQVLTEEQYWIRNALPGREDRDSLVTFEPPTPEELAYQIELKAEMKRIEEEAYEYVIKQDTDEIEKMKKLH